VSAVSVTDWADGSDPYAATAKLLEPTGHYAISDPAWAMHLLGLQEALPQTRYTSMTETLPMLRAIKDDDEIARLASAGAAADARFEDIVGVAFPGRRERDIGDDLARLLREHGHSQVDFTVVGSGPNGANPHHEVSDRPVGEGDMVVLDFGGLKDGYGSGTTRRRMLANQRRKNEPFTRSCAKLSSRVRGSASRDFLSGDRPRRSDPDCRRRLRRSVHPSDGPRNWPHHAPAAVDGRGRVP
jgi:hypothetical protein